MVRLSKGSVAIDTVPLPEKTVHVTLPLKVANDLKSFQKVQASILDRLGCPACCSGWDIRWDIARSFSINEKLDVIEKASGVIVVDG